MQTMTDNHQHQTINKAEDLQDDLAAIASTDLPFADDAQRILQDLREQQEEQNNG